MKTEFLKFFFATLIALLATLTATATDGLILTGSVTAVTIGDYIAKDRYYFKIDVILQFKNDNKEPVIILRPSSFNGTKRITFTNDYSSNSSISEVEGIDAKRPDRSGIYGKNRYIPKPKLDLVGDFLRELVEKEPRDMIFAIIPPDGYYECRDSFLVENGFKVVEEPAKNPKDCPTLIVKPEFSGLKVEYRLFIGDRPDGIDLLRKAKQNWSKFGNLIFDQDGKYSVKSNLILNLPSN